MVITAQAGQSLSVRVVWRWRSIKRELPDEHFELVHGRKVPGLCCFARRLQHYTKATQLAIGGCGAIKGAERISRTMETIKRLPELIDLDISGSGLGIVEAEAFGQALASCASGIQKFAFSGEKGGVSAKMSTFMTEVDLSGKALGTSGAILFSAFLQKCT